MALRSTGSVQHSGFLDCASHTFLAEILRVGCDMLNLLFVIDEHTDVQPANEVKRTTGIVLDALSNPDKARPVCEIALGELSRQ